MASFIQRRAKARQRPVHFCRRCKEVDKAGGIHVGEKPLFFASLYKLLSLERESKLFLYSLTAVFFCGRKRKRYKKKHEIATDASHHYSEKSRFLCIFAKIFTL